MKKLILFLVIGCFSFSGASYATSNKATRYVDELGNEVLAILTAKVKDKEKEAKLEELFLNAVDADWIGKFAMGRHWRGLDANQKKRYLPAYRHYLVQSYVPRFREYNDEKFEIVKSKSLPNKQYMVYTVIKSKDGTTISVDYKLRPSKKTFKVIDIVAEGISLITTHRDEFSSVIASKNVEYLISRLEAKAKKK